MPGSVTALGMLQGTVDRESCHQWEQQTPTRKYARGITSGSGKHGDKTEPIERGWGARGQPEASEDGGVVGRTRITKRGKVREYRQWMVKRLACPGHSGKAWVAGAE